ncbi:hypothetical protein CPB83DRAFT_123261 [Crepidotus variabilis]|uniref:Uncharacterized protein n=1 Tax=Crepidotus variabilis TaxID=179855 RepID=A0A9P6EJZ0_9AGAR|nr:hypothetical protein CPB83DRAFT_123261 [Crepidotus variabilis]
MGICRTPFYNLVLLTSCLQTVFGTLAGFVNGRSPLLYIFGKLAGGLSIATWIWVAILMRFNRRPQSTSTLSRSTAHFSSFLVLSVVWLAVGIMLATQMPAECSVKMLWCAGAAFSSALAFCTSIFSLSAAIVIYRDAKASGAGLAVNVAQVDCKVRELGDDDVA